MLEYLLKQHLCIKLNHVLLLKCVQLVVKDPHKYVQEYTILGQAILLTSTHGTKLEKSSGVEDGQVIIIMIMCTCIHGNNYYRSGIRVVFVGDQENAGVLLTFHGHLVVAADELYMKDATQATVQLAQPYLRLQATPSPHRPRATPSPHRLQATPSPHRLQATPSPHRLLGTFRTPGLLNALSVVWCNYSYLLLTSVVIIS